MSALRDSVDFFDAAPAAGPSCAGAAGAGEDHLRRVGLAQQTARQRRARRACSLQLS